LDILFQKKIREAFSSRMRSARKQEYEQLAVWYEYDGKSNQASGESSMPTLPVVDGKKSATGDFCENEWELL
jgi:fructose-1,6-bisphosphatase